MLHMTRDGWRFWLPCGLGTLLLILTAMAAQARQEVLVTEVRIIDGDTLTCLYRGNRATVDFRHIDAPELAQPYGTIARDFLVERLGKSRHIWLDVALQDMHQNNFYALVYDDGNQCLNFELLKHGLAWYVGDRDATSEFYYIYEQERRARAAKLGLWSQSSPEPPWIWLARQSTPAPVRPALVTRKPPILSVQTPIRLPATKTTAASSTNAKIALAVPNASTSPRNTGRTDSAGAGVETPGALSPQPAVASTPLATFHESAVTTSLPAGPSQPAANTPSVIVPPVVSTGFAPAALLLVFTAGLLAVVLVLTLTSLPLRLRCKLRVRALERQISSPRLLPFAVVGAVANADNRFTNEELAAIDRFCSYLELDESSCAEALHVVHLSCLDLSTFKHLLLRCVERHGSDRDLIDAMLLVCFVIASADGTFSAEEQLYLYLICTACGCNYDEYADKFMPEGGNDARATLGLSAQSDRAELQSKIALLHTHYRPAVLRRQGLTTAELAFALDRYRDIEEAAADLLAGP